MLSRLLLCACTSARVWYRCIALCLILEKVWGAVASRQFAWAGRKGIEWFSLASPHNPCFPTYLEERLRMGGYGAAAHFLQGRVIEGVGLFFASSEGDGGAVRLLVEPFLIHCQPLTSSYESARIRSAYRMNVQKNQTPRPTPAHHIG